MKTVSMLTLTLALVAGSLFMGCKKYEEGPMISFKSKKARLQQKWTEAKYIDANGNESTPSSPSTVEFKEDGTVSIDGGASSTAFTWKFSDKKDKLIFTTTFGGASSTSESTILRLTSKELWIKDDTDLDQTHFEVK